MDSQNQWHLALLARRAISRIATPSNGPGRLILAVILQAVTDLVPGAGEERSSALAYFGSPHFDTHAELIELQPEAVRSLLKTVNLLPAKA